MHTKSGLLDVVVQFFCIFVLAELGECLCFNLADAFAGHAKFLAEEQAEMHASGDAATLDMSAVKQRADVVIVNDTPSLETLEQAVEDALHVA